jgi:hypothetical protein
VRPSTPIALSGTTYRVEQAGQVMIIARGCYPLCGYGNKLPGRERRPTTAFFHIDQGL